MLLAKYARLTGLYFVGVAIIACGLYLFFVQDSPEALSNSFYFMFAGLVVTTIGAIYGHNKIAGPGSKKGRFEKSVKLKKTESSDETGLKKHIDELKRKEQEEKAEIEALKKEEAALKKVEDRKAKEIQRQRQMLEKERETQSRKAAKEAKAGKQAKSSASQHIQQPVQGNLPKSPSGASVQSAAQSGSKASGPGIAAANQQQAVVKVLMCPSCGKENDYSSKFCNSCGKKLRP